MPPFCITDGYEKTDDFHIGFRIFFFIVKTQWYNNITYSSPTYIVLICIPYNYYDIIYRHECNNTILCTCRAASCSCSWRVYMKRVFLTGRYVEQYYNNSLVHRYLQDVGYPLFVEPNVMEFEMSIPANWIALLQHIISCNMSLTSVF